ncbi:MAG: ATP-grasp domain-containing protein [Bacteroidota bacterium]
MVAALRVLVTGAGAPGIRGTLYALRAGAGDRPLVTVGVDLSEQAVGRYLVDAFHPVPPPESPGYLDALRAVCRAERVDLVLPQTTRETAVLSRHRNAFSEARVMVSGAEAVEAANDKGAVLRAFDGLGLPAPAWHLARSEAGLVEAAEALGYPDVPVAVKPPVSNGMRGLRILREAAWDARRFLTEKPNGVEVSLGDLLAVLRRGDAWPDLLVTDYLPGPEYSVDAFAGDRLAAAMPRRRDAIRSGISFETTLLPDRADLTEPTLRAAQHLGLRYAFGFQFKEDADGVPRVLECNPRVQGTMVASVFGGLNAVWLGVQECLGETPRALPDSLRTATFRRYWGGLGIVDDEVTEV